MSGLGQRQISDFISARRLPAAFRNLIERHYEPLAAWLLNRREAGKSLLVGINGAQGTGKSTLAAFLQLALETGHGWRVAVLSIDDFYLTRQARERLAGQVHPLLLTRGPPGTHDLQMLTGCCARLKALAAGDGLPLPRFDKATGERAEPGSWPVAHGPVDLVILEGWCVGSRPQVDAALLEPVNPLERKEDADGRWRHWVNAQLKSHYAAFFRQLDALIFLQAPSFSAVYRWRLEQEEKLATTSAGRSSGIMNEREVARFIQFYERLTRANLKSLPAIVDVVLELDEAHGCRRSIDVPSGLPLQVL